MTVDHARRSCAVRGADKEHVDVGVADEAPVIGRDRHQDRLVDLLSEARIALFRQNRDHPAREAARTDRRADRVLQSEEIAPRRIAEHARRPAAHLLRRIEHAPRGKPPGADREIIVRRPERRDLDLVAVRRKRERRQGDRRDDANTLHVPRNRLAVPGLQRLGPPVALVAHRMHHDDVLAHRGDVVHDLTADALHHRHDRDDRRHADDDAERRQRRAQLVGAKLPHRHPDAFEEHSCKISPPPHGRR
jgi:hypothetical protein